MKSRTPIPEAKAETRYGFLLIPEYSMMAFSAAVDQIRMANRLSGRYLYDWVVMSQDDAPVFGSNGLAIATTPRQDCGELDAVFVCGGLHIQSKANAALSRWLCEQAKNDIALGALCTGTYLLAAAGLLKDYRCTIHWENLSSLREGFPELIISSDVFEIDRDRYTCAGGSAAMDMMVSMIAQQHGWELAIQVAEEFLIERIRGRNDRQRLPLRLQFGTSQPKLAEAIAFMEANVEELISLDEIVRHVGLSRRQLERLFQKHLHCVPTKYYMQLRLRHARQLLVQTNMPIFDIALASGFASTTHFSKCYREFFGIQPRNERLVYKQMGVGGGY